MDKNIISSESFGLSTFRSSGKYANRDDFYEEIRNKAINEIKGYVTQNDYTIPTMQEIDSMYKIAKKLKQMELGRNPIGGGKELIGQGEFKMIEGVPIYTYMGRVSKTTTFIAKLVAFVLMSTISGLTFGKKAGDAVSKNVINKASTTAGEIAKNTVTGSGFLKEKIKGFLSKQVAHSTKISMATLQTAKKAGDLTKSGIGLASGLIAGLGIESLVAFIQKKRGKELIFACTFIKNRNGEIKIKGISKGEIE